MNKISIDPITRLEGHGRIDIFLDDAGDVANAYMVIPELRGFEKFAEGRLVEELIRRRLRRSCVSSSTPPSMSQTTRCISISWVRRTSSWGQTPLPPSEISWA
jgi:hypothetical protein